MWLDWEHIFVQNLQRGQKVVWNMFELALDTLKGPTAQESDHDVVE